MARAGLHTRPKGRGLADDLLDDFGDVLDLDRLTLVQAQAAVGEIRDAIGTRGDQHLGPGIDGLSKAEVREPLPFGGLHPDPAAAAAATEAVLPALLHLGEVRAGYAIKHVARRVEDSVVPAEIAGIVVGDLLVVVPHRLELAVPHQLGQELGDVDDLEIDAELRVFVLERVIAVRGGDQYPLHPVVDERLDVLAGEMLERLLIAGLANALAATTLLRPQDAEIHARLVEDLGGGGRHLLQARVVAEIAAGRVKNLHSLDERLDRQPV